jgi:hypothetical protein
VRVIGGLPADFAESPMPEATRAAIIGVFATAGARFIELGERAHYPRAAFFDTPDHLNEATQVAHSRVMAEGLVAILPPERAASRRSEHRCRCPRASVRARTRFGLGLFPDRQ